MELLLLITALIVVGLVFDAARSNRLVLDGLDARLLFRGVRRYRPMFYGIYWQHLAIGFILEEKR